MTDGDRMQPPSTSALIDQYSVGNANTIIWSNEIDGGDRIHEYPLRYYFTQRSPHSAIPQSGCNLFNYRRLYWSNFFNSISGASTTLLTPSTADLQLAGEATNE